MKYPHIFNDISKLYPIPEDEWLKLEAVAKLKKASKGTVLVEAGQPVEELYLLTQGLVKSYYISEDGKESIKIFLRKWDLASPYVEIITEIPARTSLEAITDIEYLEFDYTVIEEFALQNPCWYELHLKILQKFFIIKERREYEFLFLDARSRFENFLKEYQEYLEVIPQNQVALYLGITPVSLSRLKKSL